MGADKRQRVTISIRRQTKDSLNSIKHPGQSYDGLIQELTKLLNETGGRGKPPGKDRLI